jgi:uncharacterized protein YqeY
MLLNRRTTVSTALKDRLKDAVKAAMRAKEKERLGTIRMMQAEIQRAEVDERIEVDDERALALLDKMCKQRRDSIQQYESAGREELAAIERAEMAIIQEFLPEALTDDELNKLITQAIADSGAESARDMGKVMALLKPQVQGRADVGAVSKLVKTKLG